MLFSPRLKLRERSACEPAGSHSSSGRTVLSFVKTVGFHPGVKLQVELRMYSVDKCALKGIALLLRPRPLAGGAKRAQPIIGPSATNATNEERSTSTSRVPKVVLQVGALFSQAVSSAATALPHLLKRRQLTLSGEQALAAELPRAARTPSVTWLPRGAAGQSPSLRRGLSGALVTGEAVPERQSGRYSLAGDCGMPANPL